MIVALLNGKSGMMLLWPRMATDANSAVSTLPYKDPEVVGGQASELRDNKMNMKGITVTKTGLHKTISWSFHAN